MTAEHTTPGQRENVTDALATEDGPNGASRFKTHEYRPDSRLETGVDYDDAILQAVGHGFDDEPGQVDIKLFGAQFSFDVTLAPAEAAEFARELEAAAIAAEEGEA
jgi:hypothetical protein